MLFGVGNKIADSGSRFLSDVVLLNDSTKKPSRKGVLEQRTSNSRKIKPRKSNGDNS
jgi:hypothetical protein